MNQQLIGEIRNCLRVLGARVPMLAQRKPEKIYEVFVLGQFVTAARTARLDVRLQDDAGHQSILNIRGAPGSIYNATGLNSYLRIRGPHGCAEVQHGIYLRGVSREPHEADIAVIEHECGKRCRSSSADPPWEKSSLLTECKFYKPNRNNTNLPHGLGCHLLGMSEEFPSSTLVLCANQTKPSITNMLKAHQRSSIRRTFFDLIPARQSRVAEFRHWLAAELRHIV